MWNSFCGNISQKFKNHPFKLFEDKLKVTCINAFSVIQKKEFTYKIMYDVKKKYKYSLSVTKVTKQNFKTFLLVYSNTNAVQWINFNLLS